MQGFFGTNIILYSVGTRDLLVCSVNTDILTIYSV